MGCWIHDPTPFLRAIGRWDLNIESTRVLGVILRDKETS